MRLLILILDVWLNTLVQWYHLRARGFATLALWDDDKGAYDEPTDVCGHLIQAGYVSLNLANGLACWKCREAKHIAALCASAGPSPTDSFIVHFARDSLVAVAG